MAELTASIGTAGSGKLEWAWAGRALDIESGDLHVVAPFAGGVLAALIDGLGHGEEAATAARAAEHVLRDKAGAAVPDLLVHCHEALRRTRGAVLSVASFDLTVSTLTWAGVGNVDALLLRARGGDCGDLVDEAVLLRGGIVGYNLPPLRVDTVRVRRGDLLVMTTDGIRSGYADDIERDDAPAAIAAAILASHGRADDDARVLVARFRGGSGA